MKKIIILLLLISISLMIYNDCLFVPPLLSIVPGGGQIYNKSYIKATVIAGIEITLMYFLYNTYKNTGSTDIFILTSIAIVKVYSMIDAYIDAEMKEPQNIDKWKETFQNQ